MHSGVANLKRIDELYFILIDERDITESFVKC